MKAEFTNRAIRDLNNIATRTRRQFGDRITAALEIRTRDVIAQIAVAPEAAPVLEQRPDIRVVPLGRYPFKVSTGSSAIQCESCTSDTRHGGHSKDEYSQAAFGNFSRCIEPRTKPAVAEATTGTQIEAC
jgi:plasmid stabilization system protein ParE